MNKSVLSDDPDDDMRPEYRLSELKFLSRGRYAKLLAGRAFLQLDGDLNEAFPDSRSVEAALQDYLANAPTHSSEEVAVAKGVCRSKIVRTVTILQELMDAFPNAAAVNAALRQYLKDHSPVTGPVV